MMIAVSSPAEYPAIQRFHLVDLRLALDGAIRAANPYEVEFSASFVGPDGQALTIPGYYDGANGYVVRFSPTAEGEWRYVAHSPVAALDGVAGRVRCIPNDLAAVHGALRVDSAHPHHFIYEDGARCYLFGYEVNWLMMIDQSPSDLARIDAFLDSIAGVGFNLVTVNAYAHTCRGWLHADQERDPRYIKPSLAPWVGGNDAPDYAHFDLAFFRHYDRVMADLWRRGILAHIMIHVYNKQVNWPALGSADDERFWRYFVARYQVFCNVIWDTAKESYYQPPEYIWSRIGRIRQLDGYRRLVTVHDANTPQNRDSEWSRKWYDPRKELSDDLADFVSDQIHQDQYADARRNYLAAQRPYVNIEYGYEQGVDDLPTYNVKQDWREVLRRTWLATMGGAYPNYYYSNTAWNLFVPAPEPPGYAPHRLYYQFWQGARYWELAPDNACLGEEREGLYARANPGREVVVWDEAGAGFTLTIAGAGDALRAEWFDPLTGERREAGLLTNGAHRLSPPWGAGRWAVLHAK